jgi:hypothetical protein
MTTPQQTVSISAPNFEHATFTIRGETPYMQARFGAKAMQAMRDKMTAESTARKGTKREPRDFARDFAEAQHRSSEGWIGIPAPALRNACIDACRMVGFQMTRAKMSIFILPDGFDAVDGTPLIALIADEPEQVEMVTRNATGVADIRVRPMWRTWSARVTVRYDADQFTIQDVTNLLSRAGQQVGIGEGRPFSKSSAGLDFGRFTLEA